MKGFAKKLFAAVLAGCVALAFAGCADTPEEPVALAGISFTEETIVLTVGESRETSLSFDPLGYAARVEYRTSDGDVASVDETGTVLARGAGYAQITARAEERTASLVVQVVAPEPPPVLEPDESLSAFAGEGTETAPYEISSTEDLALLSKLVRAGTDVKGLHFLQTADLDFGGGPYSPVGVYGIPFTGVYDGGGHKVEGIAIDTTASYQGMFGYLTGTVENVDVYGEMRVHFESAYSHSYVGGVAGGMNNGACIRGCDSYVAIEGDAYLGGVVGGVHYQNDYLYQNKYSVVSDCNFYGTITADSRSAIEERAMYFGGIAGWSSGIMENCNNYGELDVEVTDDTGYVGGIVGYRYYPFRNSVPPLEEEIPSFHIVGCVNEGEISGGYGVGGICGNSALALVDCENRGDVHGFNCVGGISGISGTTGQYSADIMFLNGCKNSGKITCGLRNAGGIVGYSYNRVEECVNEGEVYGGYRTGGIVGYLDHFFVTGCENKAAVTARYGVGGIVGWAYQNAEKVEDCINRGAVSSTRFDVSGCHVGGVVGMLGSGVIVRGSDNYGTVKGGGGIYESDFTEEGGTESRRGGTGGIAGSVYRGSVVENCDNFGGVEGYIYVGGIFGYSQMNAGSRVEGCMNDADVASTCTEAANVGGIAGHVSGAGTLRDCITYGTVTAPAGATRVSDTVGFSSSDASLINVTKGTRG